MKITLIIDTSGSMQELSPTVTQEVRKLAEQHSDKRFNLVEFTDTAKVVFEDKKAKKLAEYEHKARFSTSMYDGIGLASTIIDPSEKNLIVIITDGEENSSKSWTHHHIRPLISAWQANSELCEVMFVGANIDTWAEASNLGLTSSVSWDGTAAGMASSFTLAHTNANALADGMSSDLRFDLTAGQAANLTGVSVDGRRARRKGSQMRKK